MMSFHLLKHAARQLLLITTLLFMMSVAGIPAKAVGTILVNTLVDASAVDANCSLREAITASRSDGDFQGCTGGTGEGDTIGFSVAGRIILNNGLGPLPDLLNSTTIDGTTAPGYSGVPLIIIDGVNLAPTADGISVFTDNNVVKGLAIVNFGGRGIFVSSAGANGNLFTNNYIGTADGTTAEPNDIGIVLSNGGLTSNILVGGQSANLGNVISGNTGAGIVINNTSMAHINNARIGTTANGSAPLPNGGHGIHIQGNSSNNIIGGAAVWSNLIAHNGGDGVFMEGTGDHNTVIHNVIHSNTGLGIDLSADGVTANDNGDGDDGPNGLLNFPVLTSAVWDSGTLTVDATMNTTNDTNYTVQFFLNTACDASNHGEGEQIPTNSTLNRATDATGNDSFSHDLSIASDVTGQFVTATATVIDVGTSEFSACVEVTGPTVEGNELLVNGNFDDNDDATPKIPDDWNAGGALLGDKVRTDGANTIARSAPNAFMFKGRAGETTSKIAQPVDLVGNSVGVGDSLVLSAYVNQKSAPNNVMIGKLLVKYNDGTKDVAKLRMPASKQPGYVLVATTPIVIDNTDIKKISAQLLYKFPSGKFFVDDVSLMRTPANPSLGSLIELPSAPTDLRGSQ